MPEVRLRNGFSDRNGIKKENTQMQYEDFDERTRIALCNFLSIIFENIIEKNGGNRAYIKYHILKEVYMLEVDCPPYEYPSEYVLEILKNTIKNDSYADVLTVFEYLIKIIEDVRMDTIVSEAFNDLLTSEYVGYRYVNDRIIPITNEDELESIKIATNSPYVDVNESLKKASGFLADRNHPDYENSIKESITAVEKMCSIILGKKETLGAALKQLEKNGIIIHPSLKSAFDKLYGYTCDAKGIRHGGQIGGTNSTFAEARFMLVSCSAFVNYLIEVSK